MNTTHTTHTKNGGTELILIVGSLHVDFFIRYKSFSTGVTV
jgi:hypothetical protein